MLRAAAIAASVVATLFCFAASDSSLAGDDNDAAAQGRWFVSAFGGVSVNGDYTEIVSSPWSAQTGSENLAALAFGREVGRVFGRRLAFELEGFYGYHFGSQSYHEFAAAAYARWYWFPWNDYVATSLALGIGPSYTTELPRIEAEKGHTSQWLNLLNAELTFALPDYPNHRLLLRLQHRSGLFGLIDGEREGSNFVAFGLKRHF